MFKRLRDGTPVLIRPIRPDDKHLLVEGLEHLSELSIQRRFLAPKTKFSQAELRYLTEVDGEDHVAFVAETVAGRRPVGVGRWVRLVEEPRTAEAAIVVADEWQGLGAGSILAEGLADAARAHGVARFTATMLSDNRPAQKLMAQLADHLERRQEGPGVSELVAELAA